MARPQPDREVIPAVQRLRVRYAKRGRLRFASHRDFQRAFERALRRAAVPMAYSAGFSPHPKVSYAGAAPTGAASEAEYLEIGVVQRLDPDTVAKVLDAALPPGLDVVEVVEARGGSLAERLTGARWQLELRGVDTAAASSAVTRLLARDRVEVQRRTKSGIRSFDVRAAIVALTVEPDVALDVHRTGGEVRAAPGKGGSEASCAILHLVVRHQTPAVRPDDVLSALAQVDDLVPPQPPLVTRLAQGELDETTGLVLDPLIADRDGTGPTVGE